MRDERGRRENLNVGHDELVAAAEEIGIPRAHIEAATRDIEEEAARGARREARRR